MIECREDEHNRLLGRLAIHELDVVLSDMALSPAENIKAFNHQLGSSGTSFFASPALARSLGRSFPQNLKGAPFLAPLTESALGRGLQQWFESQDIRPEIVAEIQDSALTKAMGRDGLGIFALPSVIENEVKQQYGARVIGQTDDVRETFYAITMRRQVDDEVVKRICKEASAALRSI